MSSSTLDTAGQLFGEGSVVNVMSQEMVPYVKV